jgi:hypothetical protein
MKDPAPHDTTQVYGVLHTHIGVYTSGMGTITGLMAR